MDQAIEEAREAGRRKWRKAVISLDVLFVCSAVLSFCWEPVVGMQSRAGAIGGVIVGVVMMIAMFLLLLGVPWLVGTVGRPAVVGWALAFLLLVFEMAFPK